MIQKQNDRVVSEKVCPRPDQRKPACNVHKWKWCWSPSLNIREWCIISLFLKRKHFYKEVPTRLVNKIRQKRRASWAGKTWILHHDSASAHTALSVKQFLVSKEITTLHHPPYSPDLAPCDFFLFSKLKEILKGHASKESRISRSAWRDTSKPSQKKNFHSASKRCQKEWKSASKPMGIILKETSRDDLRLACVRQCGHCMICI